MRSTRYWPPRDLMTPVSRYRLSIDASAASPWLGFTRRVPPTRRRSSRSGSQAPPGRFDQTLEMTRDLTWDAIVTVAADLNGRYQDADATVQGRRRRSLLRWRVTEGLWSGNDQAGVFEPVRSRRFFRSGWTDEQPVQAAAAKIGTRLRDRLH